MSILVVSDIQQGILRPVNAEVYTIAASLGKAKTLPVAALLMGPPGLEALADQAGRYGVERVLLAEDERLATYSPDLYASVAAQCIRQSAPELVLMAATFTGKDLMPRVAQELEAGLVQDAIGIDWEDRMVFTRPMYAGKIHAEVEVDTTPALATVRPKAYKPVEHAVEVRFERVGFEVKEPRVAVLAYERTMAGKLDVTEADIIVSGGRGMQGADRWGVLEELAGLLGAATGCSRPVSDDGWRPHEEHIGQTGKTVSPDLYIACGISGAIQHIAGVSSSKYIVAVNKDPEAPIFNVADYGIVGDVFDVLPAMIEAIREIKGHE